MLEIISGEELEVRGMPGIDALVCPATVVSPTPSLPHGYMLGGWPALFAKTYPPFASEYYEWCKDGERVVGDVFVWSTPPTKFASDMPRVLVNLPIARVLGDVITLLDIKKALVSLHDVIRTHKLTSIAIPALGHGSIGGPDWLDDTLPAFVSWAIRAGYHQREDFRLILAGPIYTNGTRMERARALAATAGFGRAMKIA